MVMVADWVPGLKRWIGALGLTDSAKLLVIRVVVAFLLHAGRMSCLQAGGSVRCEARHRAQISRFLARPRWRNHNIHSLLMDWSKWSRQTLRLAPGQGEYAVYRRLSPHRIGPKAKPRTYYVHQERRRVYSVGEVRLVFSTMKKELATATSDDLKILMTNDQRLSLRDVIEL